MLKDELKMKCLELATGSRSVCGSPESIVKLAQTFYDFIRIDRLEAPASPAREPSDIPRV